MKCAEAWQARQTGKNTRNLVTQIDRDKATYILDVLWGQPIKLIQVASNSELRENQWNDLLFFEIVPSHCFGASEVQT